MKVRPSVKKMCDKCKIIKRNGSIYIKIYFIIEALCGATCIIEFYSICTHTASEI